MTKLRDIRLQAFIVLLIIVIMGGVVSLYMIFTINKTEKSLLEQHKIKLIHITTLFDQNFEGSYEDILISQNLLHAPKKDQLKALNAELKGLAMQFSELYPETYIGCYSSDLNGIIIGGSDYNYYFGGETGEQEKNISQTLNKEHPIFIKTMDEMQYLKPLVRDGKTIGVVWAAEDLYKVYSRINNTKRNIYYIFISSLAVSLALAVFLLINYMQNITRIKNGLKYISEDLNIQLPEVTGELGEVSKAINTLGRQLNEVRSLNDVVVQSVDEGIAVINASGEVVLANEFAWRILNSINDEQNKILKSYLKEDGNLNLRKVVWMDGMEEHILYVDTGPLKYKILDREAKVITFKDITNGERLEQKIRNSERFAALGKMVAGVAHEIRNPLTSIAGYIQFWRTRGVQHLSEEALDTISKEITRLNNLVEKLLFFSKTSNITKNVVDLKYIFKDIVSFLTVTYPEIKVEMNENNFPCIYGDKDQLHSAFENIFFNAVQASSEKGTIKVSTQTNLEQKLFCISITDNGTGISADNIAYVFDPFFTTKSKGSGLGLAITYEIIKLHGGDIEIQSFPESGTTVTVCLHYKEGEELV